MKTTKFFLNLLAFFALVACAAVQALAQPATWRIDGWKPAASLPGDSWRTFAKPLPVSADEMLLFQRDGGDAVIWRQRFSSNTLESVPFRHISLQDKERFTAVQTGKGLWIIGRQLVLVRPDGGVWKTEAGLDEPVAVALADGNVMLLGSRGGTGNMHMQIARADTQQIEDVGVLAYGGTPDRSGENYRQPAYGMTATLLADGRILVAGGSRTEKRAEIFDPVGRTRSAVPDMPNPRSFGVAQRLPDGRVLVAGAEHLGCYHPAAREVDVYDPHSNTWSSLPSLPFPLCPDAYGADVPSAVIARDGAVFLGGDLERNVMYLLPDTTSPTRFAKRWGVAGNFPVQRISGVLQALDNGDVVIAGGVHNREGFGECCYATPGIDRIPHTAREEFTRSVGLNLAGAGTAQRNDLAFVAGGRLFSWTSTGQMRFSSMSELVQLSTGVIRQRASMPFADGAADVRWVDDNRILVKGRLASDDRGFSPAYSHSSYVPEGSGNVALYHVDTDTWTVVNGAESVKDARLVGVRNGSALFMSSSGALTRLDLASLAWQPLSLTQSAPSGAMARWLDDGRLILAGGKSVCVTDEETGECQEGAGDTVPGYRMITLASSDGTITEAGTKDSPPASVAANSTVIDAQGRVTQLGWKDWTEVSARSLSQERLMRPVIERSDASGEHWQQLPVPFGFYLKEGAFVPPCQQTAPMGCRLVNIEDPRHPGADLLFMVQGDIFNDDVDARRRMVLWWFDEDKKRWQKLLSAEGEDVSANPLKLPAPLSTATHSMMSMGWHLDRPLLWTRKGS